LYWEDSVSRFLRLVAIVVSASLLYVVPASAATILMKFSGEIGGGYDNTGLSGASGAGLVGIPFEVRFFIDLDTVGATAYSYPGTTALSGAGQYSLGTTYVTVGEYTWQLPQDGHMLIYRSSGTNGQPYEVYADAGSSISYLEASVLSFVEPFTTQDLSQPLSYTANSSGGSQFWFYYGNDEANQILVYSLGNPVTVTVSVVPEPATWAMMIIGFGAVGSMVRTSRRRNVFSAA
jgi:hypothetical protein